MPERRATLDPVERADLDDSLHGALPIVDDDSPQRTAACAHRHEPRRSLDPSHRRADTPLRSPPAPAARQPRRLPAQLVSRPCSRALAVRLGGRGVHHRHDALRLCLSELRSLDRLLHTVRARGALDCSTSSRCAPQLGHSHVVITQSAQSFGLPIGTESLTSRRRGAGQLARAGRGGGASDRLGDAAASTSPDDADSAPGCRSSP